MSTTSRLFTLFVLLFAGAGCAYASDIAVTLKSNPEYASATFFVEEVFVSTRPVIARHKYKRHTWSVPFHFLPSMQTALRTFFTESYPASSKKIPIVVNVADVTLTQRDDDDEGGEAAVTLEFYLRRDTRIGKICTMEGFVRTQDPLAGGLVIHDAILQCMDKFQLYRWREKDIIFDDYFDFKMKKKYPERKLIFSRMFPTSENRKEK